MLKFDELYNACEEANFGVPGESSAHVNVEQERIVVVPGDMTADPEEIEAAEKELETGEWTTLPDKYELGLGKELVFRFASENLNGADLRHLERIFSHAGAYGKWKEFLEEHGLLKKWHEFSDREKIAALKQWLAQKKIPYEDAPWKGNSDEID